MPNRGLSDAELRRRLAAWREHGENDSAASTALGIDRATFREARVKAQRLEALAALKGDAPAYDMIHPVPDPFKVKGVSTLYNGKGEVAAQWVKSSLDNDKLAALLRAAVEALATELPRAEPVPPPTATSDALMNLYTLTDCHVGMLAWAREGGDDWDLPIAARTLFDAFAAMVEGAPRAAVAIVNQLGDFLHYDGLTAVTPTSGHTLDADGRFEKMVEVAVRLLRRVVDLALARHDRVHVIMAEGNHDIASSAWLRTLFAALYENEPRVTVERSPLPYYAYQHGDVMLAFHHGHLAKNDSLPLLMAAQFSAMWGSTRHRYAHSGHRHHVEDKGHPGMRVMQHTTLAARDAYAARGGWHSERAATAITYHSRHGHVATNTVTPDMLDAA